MLFKIMNTNKILTRKLIMALIIEINESIKESQGR